MPPGLQPRQLRKWRQFCPQWKPGSSWQGGLCHQQVSYRQAQLQLLALVAVGHANHSCGMPGTRHIECAL